jgi:hypothetical protein
MSLNSQTKSLFKMTGPLISNDHKFEVCFDVVQRSTYTKPGSVGFLDA